MVIFNYIDYITSNHINARYLLTPFAMVNKRISESLDVKMYYIFGIRIARVTRINK